MKHCAPRNRVSEANSLTDGTHFPKHQFTFVEQNQNEIKAIIHQETEKRRYKSQANKANKGEHCASRNKVSEANSRTYGTHFPKRQFTFTKTVQLTFTKQSQDEIKTANHQETEKPIKELKQINPNRIKLGPNSQSYL